MKHGGRQEQRGARGSNVRRRDELVTTRGGVDGRIKRILERCADISASQVVGSARLVADLEMDSLDFVEVAFELEREFAVAVAGDGLARLATVDDLVDLVGGLSMMPGRSKMVPAGNTAGAPKEEGERA
jgi:acyl carrier protein